MLHQAELGLLPAALEAAQRHPQHLRRLRLGQALVIEQLEQGSVFAGKFGDGPVQISPEGESGGAVGRVGRLRAGRVGAGGGLTWWAASPCGPKWWRHRSINSRWMRAPAKQS